MIKLHIGEMMKKRKMTRYRMNKETGWNYKRVNALYKGEVKQISIEELDILCNILNCESKDLIESIKDQNNAKNKR